jgi:signal transduction histidine kinase
MLTALYRVARATLANVADHANATVVAITLGIRCFDGPDGPRIVQLTISDDEVGIDSTAGDHGAEGQFGLQLHRGGVESLGG